MIFPKAWIISNNISKIFLTEHNYSQASIADHWCPRAVKVEGPTDFVIK